MSDQILEHYFDVHASKSRAELLARREQVITRTAELEGYARRSQAQADELNGLIAEQIAVDDLIKRADVEIRRSKIEAITRTAQDPANLERPDGGSQLGAPALIGDRRRAESAADVLQRMRSDPWRDADGGPLAGHTSYGTGESGQGLISRAHTALEGLESALTHDGAEKLAQVLAESSGWPGMTVRRSRDEAADAARLVLALSNPHYLEAFRSVLRYPMEFTAGGTGFETMTPEQREAWRDVRTNELVRASFAESSGAVGAFALPLQLDDTIILTNAGIAAPHRRLARTVIGTSNTWNGGNQRRRHRGVGGRGRAGQRRHAGHRPIGRHSLQGSGVDHRVAGGHRRHDPGPAGAQLDRGRPGAAGGHRVRHRLRERPAIRARDPRRVGRGHGRAGRKPDLRPSRQHAPRFRAYDSAKPTWLANVNVINLARQIPAFTGANFSIVDDSGDQPRMLGYPLLESSAMTSLNTAGAKNLILADLSQYVVVDRLPTVMIFEPLIFNATPLPTGQQGWFYYARVGADITTAGAAFGSNAVIFHTV